MKYLAIALVFSAVFFIGLLAHSDWEVPEEARQRENPQSATDESVAAGRALYEKHCQSCHGVQGGGDGPLAKMLDEKPTALNDSEHMSEMSDGELHWKISTGKPPMPGLERKTSEDERWHVVNYVRSLSK